MYFYYPVFQIRLLIQRVVGSVVGLLVDRCFMNLIKFPGKEMFGVVISPVHFGRCLFCYSSFNFFEIDNKEKTSWIARRSHPNL